MERIPKNNEYYVWNHLVALLFHMKIIFLLQTVCACSLQEFNIIIENYSGHITESVLLLNSNPHLYTFMYYTVRICVSACVCSMFVFIPMQHTKVNKKK